MLKPSPGWPAHRQDTVISILVAGTLRSEAPLRDMAGRVAGAAREAERPGLPGLGAAAAAGPAHVQRQRLHSFQPSVRSRRSRPDCGHRRLRFQKATQPRPALRVAPAPLEQPRAGREPYPDSTATHTLGESSQCTSPGRNPSLLRGAVFKVLGRLFFLRGLPQLSASSPPAPAMPS